MGEKRFYGVDGAIDDTVTSEEYAAAEKFDKLRVGKSGVFFRDGFKLRFLAYRDFDRVFIRIHEVNGKLCCGKSTFQYFRMVFVRGGKEIADVLGEDEKAFDAALECIAMNCPEMNIGFVG